MHATNLSLAIWSDCVIIRQVHQVNLELLQLKWIAQAVLYILEDDIFSYSASRLIIIIEIEMHKRTTLHVMSQDNAWFRAYTCILTVYIIYMQQTQALAELGGGGAPATFAIRTIHTLCMYLSVYIGYNLNIWAFVIRQIFI